MGSWRAFSNLSTALSANLVLYSTSHSLYSLQFVFTQSSLWPSLKPGSPLKRTHSPEAPSRGDGSFSLTPRAYTVLTLGDGLCLLFAPQCCIPIITLRAVKKISALLVMMPIWYTVSTFPHCCHSPNTHTQDLQRVWCPGYCCHLESSMYTARYSVTRIIVPHLVATVGFLPIWMSSNPPPVAGGSTTLAGLRESKQHHPPYHRLRQ